MKITKKTYYRLDSFDGYWIRRAVAEVAGVSECDSEEIEFANREVAQEFAKLVLHKYAELTPNANGGSFLLTKDRDQAFAEIGGGPIRGVTSLADSSEGRFVGEPEIRIGEWGHLILHRNVETRIGRNVDTVKTVVVDGEEFTRKVTEKKWSEWYPANPDQVSVSISEDTRLEVA